MTSKKTYKEVYAPGTTPPVDWQDAPTEVVNPAPVIKGERRWLVEPMLATGRLAYTGEQLRSMLALRGFDRERKIAMVRNWRGELECSQAVVP